MISARVLTHVDKVNISFLGSDYYTTSKIPPHSTTASICLSNSPCMCMACRRTAQLSFPAEIWLPARRKQIVFEDSLQPSFPQCLFLVALERIPPFSQTFQLPTLQLLEMLFCFFPDWNFLFPYLYLSCVLCSSHGGDGEKMPFRRLLPKALPAVETCWGYIRWGSNLAEKACRRLNASKCPWPLAPVLSDSSLQVLQTRGWFKIRLCFASHWLVKPGKLFAANKENKTAMTDTKRIQFLFCCCVLPALNWG